MVEALELCRDGGLLLIKFQVIMNTMQEQRVIIWCHRPRLETKVVGFRLCRGRQVDHAQVPTISLRNCYPASWRLQQIALCGCVYREKAAIALLINISACSHGALHIQCSEAKRPMDAFLLLNDRSRKPFRP